MGLVLDGVLVLDKIWGFLFLVKFDGVLVEFYQFNNKRLLYLHFSFEFIPSCIRPVQLVSELAVLGSASSATESVADHGGRHQNERFRRTAEETGFTDSEYP